MFGRNRCFLVGAALLVTAFQASAQRRVSVKVYHAARLPALRGSRVVFGQVSGQCARELAGLLAQDLAAHQIQVVSAQELATLGASQVPLAGAPGSAELAKRLGSLPVMTISLDVSRCQALPVPPPSPGVSRTEGRILASIRVADLASGRELASEAIRAEAKKENEIQNGQPVQPSPAEVKELTLQQAATDAQHLYLPWLESKDIVFWDDKECNLKEAFDLLKTRDYEKLVPLARESAEGCKANTKVAAGAWYNLGVAYMLVRRYDEALSALDASQKLRKIKAAQEVVAECQKGKAEAETEARRIAVPSPKPAEGEVQTGTVMTNEFVIKLVEGNVAEKEILAMIAAQPAHFSLAPEDVAKLKQAGVSEAILAAMRGKK
jgi:ABC-type Zn uptake system ZnuABC Zn-binding protein ZnuA